MNLEFFYPLIATLVLSLISFVGILTIPFEKNKKSIPLLVALAAGAMIGDVFLHIIPEIVQNTDNKFEATSFIWLIGGITLSYLLETVFHWHHQHSSHDTEMPHTIGKMSLVGDSLHNFFDGLGIAVAFAVSPGVGIATTVAFMIHELPQEIGDFAIYINSGWSRKKALLLNFASALTAILGVIVGMLFIGQFKQFEMPILLLTAGTLIYIALADLIPESNNLNMKHHKNFRFIVFCFFALGVGAMYGLTFVEGWFGL
jgi:zinc and cadmium transporter